MAMLRSDSRFLGGLVLATSLAALVAAARSDTGEEDSEPPTRTSNGPNAVERVSQDAIYRIEGQSSGDFFGVAVAGGGDVNGDSTPDFIVGAYNYVQQSPYLALAGQDKPTSGYVQVFSGSSGNALHIFHGKSEDCAFGISVANAGDTDKDGHSDILVGSPFMSAKALISPLGLQKPGEVYVYSGADGSVLTILKDPKAGSSFGRSVAGVGDINGDGHADIAVGSRASSSGDGAVLIYSGKDWTTLYRLKSNAIHSDAGAAVASAGDVNADGVPDILIGDSSADGEARNMGVARVFSGASGDVLHTWRGKAAFCSLGSAVAGLGDLNGDGHSDLLVCAKGLDRVGSNAGGAFVYSGKDGTELFSIDGPGEHFEFGIQCCVLGDVSGDGIPDFVVAAAGDGRARVYSGANGDLLFHAAGMAVASAGDITGDGKEELVTGVSTSEPGAEESKPGVVSVFSVAEHTTSREERR
jgi:hypothetical protein